MTAYTRAVSNILCKNFALLSWQSMSTCLTLRPSILTSMLTSYSGYCFTRCQCFAGFSFLFSESESPHSQCPSAGAIHQIKISPQLPFHQMSIICPFELGFALTGATSINAEACKHPPLKTLTKQANFLCIQNSGSLSTKNQGAQR